MNVTPGPRRRREITDSQAPTRGGPRDGADAPQLGGAPPSIFDRMIWLPDELPDDPRLIDVGCAGRGLLVDALCYSGRNRTDGFIPAAQLRRLAFTEPNADQLIELLARRGVFVPTEQAGVPGFLIDETYSRLQLTTEQLEERRKRKAEAGRLGGKRSGEVRRRRQRSKHEAKPKQLLRGENGEANEAESKQNRSSDEAEGQANPKQNRSPVPVPLVPEDQERVGADAPAPTRELLARFDELYREATGFRATIVDGKDGKLFAKLCQSHGADVVHALLDAYFKSRDEWTLRNGYSVGKFFSQVANGQLVAQLGRRHRAAAPAPDWREECALIHGPDVPCGNRHFHEAKKAATETVDHHPERATA